MTSVLGVEYCLPDEILTNEQLAERFGKDEIDGVISVVGVETRHIGGSAIDLGYAAARRLMARLGIYPDTIGLLIFVSESGDYRIPANACILQEMLGLRNDTICFDISMGCSGYPHALKVADSLIRGEGWFKFLNDALIINADTITRFIDPTSRGLSCIHGNGAAATMLGDCSGASLSGEIVLSSLGSDGKGASAISLLNENGEQYVHMDGAAVSHYMLKNIPRIIRETVETDELSLLLLHQANQQITDSIYNALEIPKSKRFCFLKDVGNLSNASTPVLLAEAWSQGKINHGDLVGLCAFGAGFSWGVTLLQF